MALTPSSMMPLGTQAPHFELIDVVSGQAINISNLLGEKGLLVMFICPHCPYVIHIQGVMTRLANEFQFQGIGAVAISSNDVEKYPMDAPPLMREQALELGFEFPYLYDESQEVARAYGAECTPDFFLFDQELKCVYRGRMDEATPGNEHPVTGSDLRQAMTHLIGGEPISEVQKPSMGCNIKWK